VNSEIVIDIVIADTIAPVLQKW